MKKSAVIAGTLVVAAAAYTGASWYVGVQTEKTIRSAIDRTNARIVSTLGPDLDTQRVRIDITEYQRGVFSTEARYVLLLQNGDERTELGIADHMHHGPFPWALVKQGDFTPLLAFSRSQLIDTEALKRWFDAARGTMPLQIDTRIGFGGEGESVWSFAPLEWAVEGDRLSFSGGQMNVRFGNEMRDNEAEGKFASLVMGDGEDGETVSLKDIVLRTRTVTQADETVQTTTTLDAASLMIADMTDEAVTVDKVRATLESTQKGKLLDADLRYDFDQIRVGEIVMGSVTVGGQVASFDYEAFSALLSEYDAIVSAHDAEDGEDFEMSDEEAARLMQRLVPVLASSPRVAVQPVQWRNEKGESTLALTVAFQPVSKEAAAAVGDLPAQALREMRLEVVLSRAMFLQAFAQTGSDAEEKEQLEMLAGMLFDQYVDDLESDGIVRRDGDRAIVTIVYGDNTVDVNGEKMNLEEFLMLFADFLF